MRSGMMQSRPRVMLVDDNAVARALMTRWIEEDGAGEVVAAVANGRLALSALAQIAIDVIVLDIEMPEMDGLAALPQLLALRPAVRVLMSSALTERHARITLEALRLGAADALAKPRAGWNAPGAPDFRSDLCAKVRALGIPSQTDGKARVVRIGPPKAWHDPRDAQASAIVIGASTGGPRALFRLFEQLPAPLCVPVLITQHIPAQFTRALAEQLARTTRHKVVEAQDMDRLRPGVLHLAPGDRHMEVEQAEGGARIHLTDDPPDNFCRPSVNALFRSAADVWGDRLLALVLTGMGSDGLAGARVVAAAGGEVVAQDHETSVVWGMPGSVAGEGVARHVLPLDDIAARLRPFCQKPVAS